jgi:aspartyl-tRNA(Asn)/glutamyl-tRNA(Gln) amidotransferase subunit A
VGDRLARAHQVVMAREAYEAHGELLGASTRTLLGPRLRALLDEGSQVSAEQAGRARADIASSAAEFWSRHQNVDAILALPAPDVAPRGLTSTGPTHYLVPWTALGGPLVVVPTPARAHGLPLAVMVAARPGADRTALDVAGALAAGWSTRTAT